MIFLETGAVAQDADPELALSARHLLSACTAEAAYLAATIATLDRDLARACTDLSPEAIRCLQGIDLISQEIAGLARLMQLVDPDEVEARTLDPDQIRLAAPLRNQRSRLQSGGGSL